MRHETILNRDSASLVVIDVQEKLLDVYEPHLKNRIIERTIMLIRGARVFSLPIIVTEQYPKGIGPTNPDVEKALAEDYRPLVKETMSCCGDEAFVSVLRDTNRRQVILCGIEAHVCVQQTALDLLADGYTVHLCADATGSRRPEDYQFSLRRLENRGATVTTAESALFELLETSRSPDLKPILEVVK